MNSPRTSTRAQQAVYQPGARGGAAREAAEAGVGSAVEAVVGGAGRAVEEHARLEGGRELGAVGGGLELKVAVERGGREVSAEAGHPGLGEARHGEAPVAVGLGVVAEVVAVAVRALRRLGDPGAPAGGRDGRAEHRGVVAGAGRRRLGGGDDARPQDLRPRPRERRGDDGRQRSAHRGGVPPARRARATSCCGSRGRSKGCSATGSRTTTR